MIYLLILRTAEELAPSHRLGLPFRVDTDVIHRTIFVRFHRTWARFFFFFKFLLPRTRRKRGINNGTVCSKPDDDP